MAVIEFPAYSSENVRFYFRGEDDNVELVGNGWFEDQLINRVVRYTVIPPAEGASKIKLHFNAKKEPVVGTEVPLRYYLGTDPESHINAWDTSEYTGDLTREEDGCFTAEFSSLLIPGTVYYLFVFPASSKIYGMFEWVKTGNPVGLTMELLGGAGIVYVGNAGGGADMYQCFTRIGDTIYLLLPYVGNADGSADLLS